MNDVGRVSVEAGWARVGVQLACAPAPRTPDLERLLIDSARSIPGNPRLLDLLVTWLSAYHAYVAVHRLVRLIVQVREDEPRAVLGLVLESVRSVASIGRFDDAIDACRPLGSPVPLFEVDRASAGFARLAEANASALSRRWGLLASEATRRPEAIRPAWWIGRNNPELRERAVRGGDLRASIILALRYDAPGRVASKAQLARLCGATDAATLHAITRLEHEGAVEVIRTPGVRRHEVRLIESA